MAKKMKQLHALPKFGTEKCPVYLLRLPWLGSVSTHSENPVKSAVKQCFSFVEPNNVYSANELLSATNKIVLPALQKSNERDLSILKPLRQPVCRPYLQKAAGRN